ADTAPPPQEIINAQERLPARENPQVNIGAVLMLLALAGCAHYEAAPLDPTTGANDFAARRLSEPQLGDAVSRLMPPGAAVGGWPPGQWDRAELLAVALAQNPQIAVARAQVKAALAREITARETPNPDLVLQSEYARHDVHPWLYGVSVNWLLRSSGRRRLDNEIAARDTHNARLQLMDQAWSVRRALAAALSDWESARERARLLDRLAAAQNRLLTFEQQRIAVGEDAPVELIASQQARIQVERQSAELREVIGVAQAAAAKALGLPPEALDEISFVWPDWGAPPPIDAERQHQAREKALLSRADLAVAVGDYAQAETKLQQSIARQYPQFVLGPGYYWDHGIAKFPFDVGFALPLNRNKGEIAEARAAREVAGRRMLAVQAGIYGDIAAAERAEFVARASAEAAERQLAIAQRQKQQSDLGLRLGAADRPEQIGTEISIARAELELLLMRARLQSARNDLEDALRAPLSGPELALAESMVAVAAGAGS
ncbi:MAG: TolC family protein, partial [Pseudomonadota bacterium]|nr:TolC family protein [Pseudomonadota bacterium]